MIEPDGTLFTHIVSRVEERSDTGCWIYRGTLNTHGYGRVYFKGRRGLAHRMLYAEMRDGIPEGLVLDHLCRTPACVNPIHLDPVTQRENLLRGVGVNAVNARKVSCPQGHPLVTRWKSKRVCLICRAEASRRSHAKNGAVFNARRRAKKAAAATTLEGAPQ